MSAAEHAAYGKNLTSPLPRHRIVDSYSFAGPSPQKPVASPWPFLSGTPNYGPNFPSSLITQDNNRTQDIAVSKPGNIGQQCMIGFVGQQRPRFPHKPMEYGVTGSNTLAPGAQNMAQPFNVSGDLYGGAMVTSIRNVTQPLTAAGNCGGGVTASNTVLASNTFGMSSDQGVNNWDDGDQLTEAELIDYVEKEDDGSKARVDDGGVQDGSKTVGNCPTDVSPSASNDAEKGTTVSVSVDESSSDIAFDRSSVENTAANGIVLDGVQSATRKLFT